MALLQVMTADLVMTVKLLRYLLQHKHRNPTSEVALVGAFRIMFGVKVGFYNNTPAHDCVCVPGKWC